MISLSKPFSILAASLAVNCALAQGWRPSAFQQIPIWPKSPPDQRPNPKPESFKVGDYVAGKQWIEVDNVTRPTLTFYPAKGNNTKAAVIVFPGGGYEILAIDLEGTEVCEWFANHGINAVLLKYRVPAARSDPYWGAYPQSKMALEDAQRTIRLVRYHATDWHIDPHKVGVIGFSAGGHLVTAISTNFEKRLYPARDAADKESCRPDFGIALYPGHLRMGDSGLKLNSYVPVTKRTPPQFLLQAEDDHVDSVNDALSYYIALKDAGVPAEMHLYSHGGHGFGLRRTKQPITGWPDLVLIWLKSLGMIH